MSKTATFPRNKIPLPHIYTLNASLQSFFFWYNGKEKLLIRLDEFKSFQNNYHVLIEEFHLTVAYIEDVIRVNPSFILLFFLNTCLIWIIQSNCKRFFLARSITD